MEAPRMPVKPMHAIGRCASIGSKQTAQVVSVSHCTSNEAGRQRTVFPQVGQSEKRSTDHVCDLVIELDAHGPATQPLQQIAEIT